MRNRPTMEDLVVTLAVRAAADTTPGATREVQAVIMAADTTRGAIKEALAAIRMVEIHSIGQIGMVLAAGTILTATTVVATIMVVGKLVLVRSSYG